MNQHQKKKSSLQRSLSQSKNQFLPKGLSFGGDEGVFDGNRFSRKERRAVKAVNKGPLPPPITTNVAPLRVLRFSNWPIFPFGTIVWDDGEPPKLPLPIETKFGEIIAYRAWRVERFPNGGYRLRSVFKDVLWKPGEVMGLAIDSGRIEDVGQIGVHAWKERSHAVDYIHNGFLFNPGLLVVGQVKLWGTVIEHEIGYRAEYARIMSLDWIYGEAEDYTARIFYINDVLVGETEWNELKLVDKVEVLNKLREIYGVNQGVNTPPK